MAEIKYIVRRAFRYGNLRLKPGDEFIPGGGLFDEQIVKSHLVKIDDGGKLATKHRRAWRAKRFHGKLAEPQAPKAKVEVIEPVIKKPVAKKPAAKKPVAKPVAKKGR